MLRHCLLQMQAQSHPVDHAVFVNSPDADEDHAEDKTTSFRYDTLLDDASEDAKGRVFLGYGPSFSLYQNLTLALSMVDLVDYDLFLRVDDDDIYLSEYVAGVVADFVANRWDYSGTHSHGVLNGHRWHSDQMLSDLGPDGPHEGAPVPGIMPGTAAFSRRAIDAVLGAPDNGTNGDQQWRVSIAKTELVMRLRHDENFIYNIHSGNMSTGSWLKP